VATLDIVYDLTKNHEDIEYTFHLEKEAAQEAERELEFQKT
jgi:hypothetical protein